MKILVVEEYQWSLGVFYPNCNQSLQIKHILWECNMVQAQAWWFELQSIDGWNQNLQKIFGSVLEYMEKMEIQCIMRIKHIEMECKENLAFFYDFTGGFY